MRILILLFSLAASTVHAASPEPVYGKNGMVASRSQLASQVGVDIMRQGGNAVDAAVATAFALAVTYPSAGNLGGGSFAVIRLSRKKVVTLDQREMAPAAASRDMFLDERGQVIDGLSRASHLASGVPGSVDGLLTMLKRYGKKSREEVMAPAIRLAREGFPLSWSLARSFERQLGSMKPYAASMAKFSKEGKAYKPGDLWVQEDLARTLERIAEDGREGFYEGETADLIVAEMQRGGGIITHEDLKNYKSVWRDPIYGTYRGYDIYGMGPPSSGGVLVQQMLNMLESYDLRRMGYGSSSLAHLMIEAERRAFADRAEYLGDPDFVNVPISILTLKEYAKYRMRDFDPDKATPSDDIGAGRWPPESPETTHFSVMDGRGMMVAFTTTLNSGYGNKVVVPGAGFLMNNEMDDFSIKPNVENQFQLTGGKANAIEPGKRMLSSVAPTIVMQGSRPVLITGSPGGSTIITTVLQVIINALDHEMPLNDAVSLPRFHNQWKPDQVLTETYTFSPETLHSLQQRGHILRPASFPLGDANSIMMKAGLMHGMSDPRGGGAAVGF